jgi:gamma-glutamylcyclotransferase (GGCT)/AIG2-like uncharacterized protein YtfP
VAILYFAYGSNLGESVLRTRCPRARQVGIAKIDGFRVGFTRKSTHRGGGVANLVAESGATVWGALFDLSEDGFDILDEYEGAPTAYRREVWDFARPDLSIAPAWVYVVVSPQLEVPPSHRYWKIIVEGAREAGLPSDYVARLEGLAHLPER